jgi:ATP-dependent DNA helicase RecG
MPYTNEKLVSLIHELRKHKNEMPWVEFKHNNADPEMIGQTISALSNSAALHEKPFGYLVWGIEDSTHEVVGTNFIPAQAKKGNQSLELWLSMMITPQTPFYFRTIEMSEHTVVLLEIGCAGNLPVKFTSEAYIRIDSNNKKLKDYPELERELWIMFNKKPFELMIAIQDITADQVLKLLDYPTYFELLDIELPSNRDGILSSLIQDKMIAKGDSGHYNITNLGAILFARKLSDFEHLERKSIRVIKYNGNSRTASSSEQIGAKGYASGFEGLIGYINGLIPKNEIMGQALRKDVPMFPEIAVRELVANAIVHQDFFMRGTGPMIEIFDDRIEITNPGIPLIEKDRFVDHPPLSRNEHLASFMRRVGVCEERGSGYDKVISQTEFYQLPAPEIGIFEQHTKVMLFSHKTFAEMSKEDRIRACYLHACLKRVNREYATNSSLRERFKIDAKNSSMISRLLKEAHNVGLIKYADENSSDKYKKYVPYWA